MKFQMRRMMIGVSLATGLVVNCALASDTYAQQTRTDAFSKPEFCKLRLNGDVFARTELFFGLSKPDGSIVTEEEFQLFIDNQVTPLFPDGLTLLTGTGQFKGSTGTVIKEGSKLLILLYPLSNESNRAIKQIQQVYINNFQQESVLRVDDLSCVSF